MEIPWQRARKKIRRYIIKQEKEAFFDKLSSAYICDLIILGMLLMTMEAAFHVKNPIDYLSVFLLGMIIPLPFLSPAYKRYTLFRANSIYFCYGRCAGKIYISTRYMSEFTLDIVLENGTVWEKMPVRSKVCQEIEINEPVLVAQVNIQEIRGVYRLPAV